MEPVTLFTLTNFFSSDPERVKKGLNSYNSNRVSAVNVQTGGAIQGTVQASMKKKFYRVEVENQMVSSHSCQCPIGQEKCHHMAALLIWVEKNITRTDMECQWSRPKAVKEKEIVAKRVSEMAPTTSIAGIKRPVAAEDKEWAAEQLTKLGRFTGMRWILSAEPAEDTPGMPGSISQEAPLHTVVPALSDLLILPTPPEAIARPPDLPTRGVSATGPASPKETASPPSRRSGSSRHPPAWQQSGDWLMEPSEGPRQF
uniref:uncharacterized protein isoform X2 n=1 Tax=Myxine glutinosa TaxID=7769 RepID=UPI00358E4B05